MVLMTQKMYGRLMNVEDAWLNDATFDIKTHFNNFIADNFFRFVKAINNHEF
jgi:hypothetical protein